MLTCNRAVVFNSETPKFTLLKDNSLAYEKALFSFFLKIKMI